MFYWIEVWRVGGQEHQLDASLGGQLRCLRSPVKTGVVKHHHTAGRQRGQEHLLKIGVYERRVAAFLKDHWSHQPAILPRPDNVDATGSLPADALVDFLASWRACALAIEAPVNAAFVQIIDAPGIEPFEFALEEPALHLVAFPIASDFFLK